METESSPASSVSHHSWEVRRREGWGRGYTEMVKRSRGHLTIQSETKERISEARMQRCTGLPSGSLTQVGGETTHLHSKIYSVT